MNRLLPLLLDGAVAAVVLAPTLCLIGRNRGWSMRRTFSCFAMALYLCLVFSLVGLPDIRYIRFQPNINLRPFRYFFTDRTTLPNVLLFVPLGLFLTTLWGRFASFWRALLFGFWVSMTIELLQIFTFRATDVNDLITNTLGTVLGWGLGKLTLALFPGFHPSDKTREVYGLCWGSFGFMVLVHPVLADPHIPAGFFLIFVFPLAFFHVPWYNVCIQRTGDNPYDDLQPVLLLWLLLLFCKEKVIAICAASIFRS